jgi:hypothetical protein
MTEPSSIKPDALYDDGALAVAFGITPNALAAARRSGTLRHARIGRRVFYKGAWLSAWLEGIPAASIDADVQGAAR